MEKEKVCKYESKKVVMAILKSEKVDFKAKKKSLKVKRILHN